MKQFIPISLTLGLLCSVSSKLAIAAESKVNINNNNTTTQMDKQIKAGKFIYDSANNKIYPLNFTQANQSANSTTDSQAEYKNPQPQTKDPRIDKLKFEFDNSYDYGTCLDAILLVYEKRIIELENVAKNQCANNIFTVFGNSLSKDISLQLIYAANTHATQVLEDKLYPSLGLRRRVAINLGYIYDIDRRNEDILKYVITPDK